MSVYVCSILFNSLARKLSNFSWLLFPNHARRCVERGRVCRVRRDVRDARLRGTHHALQCHRPGNGYPQSSSISLGFSME